MSRPIPGPVWLTATVLGLVALNLILLAAYRLLFVAWFARGAAWGEVPSVLLHGLRLDAALLGLELLAIGGLTLLTRHARGGVLVAGLWAITTINAIVAAVNLLFVRERNQHLWEMLFAYLAEPRDIWVALRPFLLGHPVLVALVVLVSAGLVTLATRHVRRLGPHRYDLWRPWYVPALALGLLALLALTMVQPITVKRVGGRPKTEMAWIASRHHMALDDYVLNQAVVNPLWDLIREYLPVAMAGGRAPYRLEPAEALPLAQRLLGIPEGDRPYPLLRTLRGTAGLGIRNVVVIQVEGLGTTLLEHDEPQGPVMPFLRSLAAEGLYFPRVYQSFPSTDGAVFATLTSLHWTHALGGRGVRLSQSVMGTYFASLPRLLTAPDAQHYAFSGFRHRTADLVSFQRNLGFRTAGFDALEKPLGPAASGPLGINDGPLLLEAARVVIASPGPFSVYVMTGTSHSPWQVPPEAPAPLGNTPLGTFRYADDSIRAFVERLRAERRDFDQTLLVITGDHTGPTFGPHPLERLRLPLILAGPPITRARARWPARPDRTASEVDVLPTIASLLEGDRAYAGMGRSLFEAPVTAGIISGDTKETFYFKDGFALRYRLHQGQAELLAVDGDAMPPADLSREHPEVASRLTREFLALYETTDRLMRENRLFPIDPGAARPPRAPYTRADVVAVARRLLGSLLVAPARDGRRVSGIIVETEAYRGPEDRASHAYGGRRTRRTETMYAGGGTAYVYFVYGMYHQFNVVTNVADVPHAVLVRALEPVEGVELMRRRRGGAAPIDLTSGPGKLCIALGIDRRLDGADLLGDRIWLEAGRRVPPAAIAAGPRVGIDYALEWAARPWRFWLRGNPFVSRAGLVRRAGAARSGRAPT